MSLRDGWRLSVGTLTALPVAPPGRVDGRTAAAAMLLAPAAVLPLGAAVAGVVAACQELGLPALLGGVLAVAVLAVGTRVMHWDGLSDVADGLTASYDAERSLEVMKTGTSGPAGTVAVVVVLALQAAALGGLPGSWGGAVLAGVAVVVSRWAPATCCARGVPAARPDGLGATFAGTLPGSAVVAGWVVAAGAMGAACWWAGLEWWRGVVAVAVGALVVAALLRRVTARFGGVTGDVLGAAVELSLAALLVAVA
ncbi:adenosylcobinamide-GDP ribazoletransferase [Nocardioides sp. KR10-350]|uniref:adenosylcobinamide-GDP ribazoletransferase n=1 Tax=Nocardioides cheoyonin TaxID=3156615 RepID=UPI0032B61B11